MAAQDVLKAMMKEAQTWETDARRKAINEMGDAYRGAKRLTLNWAPGAALEIVQHPSEYSAAIYEAKNLVTRLQEAIEALQNAERQIVHRQSIQKMVDFDAACEAKKKAEKVTRCVICDREIELGQEHVKGGNESHEVFAHKACAEKEKAEALQIAEDLLDLEEQTRQAREMDREEERQTTHNGAAPFRPIQTERGTWNIIGPAGHRMQTPAGEYATETEALESAENMTLGYLRVTK